MFRAGGRGRGGREGLLTRVIDRCTISDYRQPLMVMMTIRHIMYMDSWVYAHFFSLLLLAQALPSLICWSRYLKQRESNPLYFYLFAFCADTGPGVSL